MKTIYIIKAGTTFPATQKAFGDFDKWTAKALDLDDIRISSVDAEHGANLPEAQACSGVVITGSHSMVTDNAPWSVNLEKWIAALLKEQVPVFGICYGHQLLARAAGGRVGYHPKGKEIGTVTVQILPDCLNDPIFKGVPDSFSAHVTHSQTVLDLPKGAVRLAANGHEPNHAFRLGKSAWGVQFHPEYNTDIMQSYIQEQTNELQLAGHDVSQLLKTVSETPVAAGILKRFGDFIAAQPA